MQSPDMRTAILSFLVAVCLVVYAYGAKNYEATVDRVVDGDTFTAFIDLGEDVYKRVYVRFYKVSAAERGTKEGDAAKKKLTEILPRGTPVFLDVKMRSHGRLVCVVWAGNTNLNERAVRLGICRNTSTKERN